MNDVHTHIPSPRMVSLLPSSRASFVITEAKDKWQPAGSGQAWAGMCIQGRPGLQHIDVCFGPNEDTYAYICPDEYNHQGRI